MVRMPMSEDDVGDVIPACSDPVQSRLNCFAASTWTRVDQQQPCRVANNETTYVHRHLNRTCNPGRDAEFLDDRFYLDLRVAHHAPFEEEIMTQY